MNESLYREEYSGMSLEALKAEREKQQKIEADQTAIWETTDLTSPIVMTAFGLIFIWLLPLSIPLLVIGIPRIVNNAKLRNRCNMAIYHARDRIAVLDILIRNKEKDQAGAAGATEVEVVA
jgi:hypothetical protein